MVNHRSPKPELQVRLLPLLPTSACGGMPKLRPSAADIRQAARGTTESASRTGNNQVRRGTTELLTRVGINQARRSAIKSNG